MIRRTFISTTAVATGSIGLIHSAKAQSASAFNLNYAPGFRHFVHSAGKDPALQQKIGDKLASRDMTMGVFVTGFGMITLPVSKASSA